MNGGIFVTAHMDRGILFKALGSKFWQTRKRGDAALKLASKILSH